MVGPRSIRTSLPRTLSCTYVLNCNRGNNKHSYDDDDDDDDNVRLINKLTNTLSFVYSWGGAVAKR